MKKLRPWNLGFTLPTLSPETQSIYYVGRAMAAFSFPNYPVDPIEHSYRKLISCTVNGIHCV